jgi:hypothetical protein
LAITGGAGGATASNGTDAGGAGAAITVTSGVGGAASAGTGNGGAGGVTSLVGGAGGASAGGTGGAGGNVVLTGGAVGSGGSPKAGIVRHTTFAAFKQAAAATATVAATLTVSQLMTQLIDATPDATGSTHNYTLPTGTNLDGGAAFSTGDSFDWSIVNLAAAAADTITLVANTDHTIVGNPLCYSSHSTTIANSSAMFRTYRTGANTWVTRRLS